MPIYIFRAEQLFCPLDLKSTIRRYKMWTVRYWKWIVIHSPSPQMTLLNWSTGTKIYLFYIIVWFHKSIKFIKTKYSKNYHFNIFSVNMTDFSSTKHIRRKFKISHHYTTHVYPLYFITKYSNETNSFINSGKTNSLLHKININASVIYSIMIATKSIVSSLLPIMLFKELFF